MTSPNADDTTAEETASRSAAPQGARSLTLLASLGTASALWAIFLWRELLAARAGEDPFCGFGESTDCGTLWSAAFASKIHDLTGLPVAGWGLAWGLVATVLPLIALARAQRGGAARAAIELTAAAGIAGIVVLLAASAAEGLFCTSCAVTYVLTIVYAVVTFGSLRQSGGERSAHSVTLAIATTLAAYLLLLYPGLKTPKSQAEEGQQALIDATQRAA
ncbi:MAG: vitamin K epoxide reductase family protein, partial [Acidobacteriota bacterium]